MKKIFLGLCVLVFLGGCKEGSPDLTGFVPSYFPIKEIAYSKSLVTYPCSVNVYLLEEGFQQKFSEDMLDKARRGRDAYEYRYEPIYSPWEKSPVDEKTNTGASVNSAWVSTWPCFEDQPLYLQILRKYASSPGAYYTNSGGSTLFYIPKENLVAFTIWD